MNVVAVLNFLNFTAVLSVVTKSSLTSTASASAIAASTTLVAAARPAPCACETINLPTAD